MNKHQITAKKYLSQAFGLNQRIESKLGQIEGLHNLATRATVTYSDMPGNPKKHSGMEDAVTKIIDLEAEINKDMVELVELKKDIIGRIKAVESAELQTILELRYLSYTHWEEIAIELGYGSITCSDFTDWRWMRSGSRKQYSKIKFDTVRPCDNVKMAKAKDRGAVTDNTVAAFLIGGDICAKKTKEAVQVSRLSELN